LRAVSKPTSTYCLRTLETVGCAHLHRLGDLLIYPARSLRALVGLEQDASVGELAGGGGASGDQAFQLDSLCVTQDNGIFLLRNAQNIPTVLPSNQISQHALLAGDLQGASPYWYMSSLISADVSGCGRSRCGRHYKNRMSEDNVSVLCFGFVVLAMLLQNAGLMRPRRNTEWCFRPVECFFCPPPRWEVGT